MLGAVTTKPVSYLRAGTPPSFSITSDPTVPCLAQHPALPFTAETPGTDISSAGGGKEEELALQATPEACGRGLPRASGTSSKSQSGCEG